MGRVRAGAGAGVLALLLALILLPVLAGPADAHALRVFAKVEGGDVAGYGFFVGGGRPQGAAWRARMGEETIAEGRTDSDGGFRFAVPVPVTAEIVVTIDTGEGHLARTSLAPERFGGIAAPAPEAAPVAQAPVAPAGGAATRAEVEAAVAAQVAPLLERIEAMDARMRLTDLVAGIAFIIGLAGVALWARGRRP